MTLGDIFRFTFTWESIKIVCHGRVIYKGRVKSCPVSRCAKVKLIYVSVDDQALAIAITEERP